MSNKIYFTVVFIACLRAVAFADIGSYYIMQSTITMKDGTVQKGYFPLSTDFLYIGSDDHGFYYFRADEKMRLRSEGNTDETGGLNINEADYHFHTYVQRVLYDSIPVYSVVAMIRYANNYSDLPVPVYMSTPIRLHRFDIADMTIHRVYTCLAGRSVESHCEATDLSWLKSAEITGTEALDEDVYYCDYTACFFRNNKHEQDVLLLLDALEKLYNDLEANYNQDTLVRIEATVETLRKHHVIIVSSCSC